MNPHISVPRQYASSSTFGVTTPANRGSSIRMPRFFKRCAPYGLFLFLAWLESSQCVGLDVMMYANYRDLTRLFKFPQMDFEMAIWEMTSLLIAPKKVFKSIYYHVSVSLFL